MNSHNGVSHAALLASMPRMTARSMANVLAYAYRALGLSHLDKQAN